MPHSHCCPISVALVTLNFIKRTYFKNGTSGKQDLPPEHGSVSLGVSGSSGSLLQYLERPWAYLSALRTPVGLATRLQNRL